MHSARCLKKIILPHHRFIVSLHPISQGNHEALYLRLAVGKREKLPNGNNASEYNGLRF